MSQVSLAEELGVTFQQVQKYEKGRNRISASRFQQICQVLRMPIAFFFDGAPDELKSTGELPDYTSAFLTTSDGLALARAFQKISDPKLRRAVVALVEQVVSEIEA